MRQHSTSGSEPTPRGTLVVLGTGMLAGGHLTPQAVAELDTADQVFHLLGDPVTRMWLEGAHPRTTSLADAYAEGKPRHRSYGEMEERLLNAVRQGQRVCAVFYGHPGVFATVGHAAIRVARHEGHAVRMLPAISAADCLYADLGLDPGEAGCQSFEATDFVLRRRLFDPTAALILWQIGVVGVEDARGVGLWSRAGLRFLAEILAETYPAEHEVTVYEAAMLSVCSPRIDRMPLEQLGAAEVDTASTLYVPPLGMTPVDAERAARLHALRAAEEKQVLA